MGIATGMIKEGTAPASSAVLELAKLVSDAGAGGQILMCRETFYAIKDMTAELGAVTEKDKDASELRDAETGSSWLSCMWSVLWTPPLCIFVKCLSVSTLILYIQAREAWER